MDWREFVESMSVVEQTLREDPAGIYAAHGFRHPRPLPARDRENRRTQPPFGGRRGAQGRPAGARKQGHVPHRQRPPAAHVGYYLIDAGLHQLEGTAEAAPGRDRAGPGGQPLSAAAVPWRHPAADRCCRRRSALHGHRSWAAPTGRSGLWCCLRSWGPACLAVALVNWLATLATVAASAAPHGLFQRAFRPSPAPWWWCRPC